MVALSGQNPRAFLHERDPFERSVMQAVAERHLEWRLYLNKDLANRVIEAYAKATDR